MTAYLTLLFISFLAATILPLSSELTLVALLNTGIYSSLLVGSCYSLVHVLLGF